jgi:hypothetical protein
MLGLLMVVGLLVPVVLAAPASAADPNNVSVTLEGCRLGTFDEATNTCNDADYTTGNLQPGWNEFDLVPHRLTLDAKNSAPATQTYTVGIAFDNIEGGTPGYDRILEPVLNEDLSTGSATNCAFTFTATQTKTPGIGGTDTTIYRLLTVTQEKNTVCVFDTAARLAIGASEYPGSSLHANATDANVATAGIGARDVSIPVAPIQPQELSKDLSAVQNADVDWNITKGSQPATIEFGDVCATGDTELTTTVDITVNWENLGAVPAGVVSVTTNVYATNPAHRDITVDVTDTVSSGGNTLYTVVANDVLVQENETKLVLTDTRDVDAADVVNGELHNEAVAQYFDAVFNEPVPGQTSATADATVQDGTTTDASVVIGDSESITGTGLTFSVDSFSGASGSFDGGYVAGTPTTGPVGWTSDAQTATGSVTFSKTVYLAAGTGSTTGSLDDTATLGTDDGISKEASQSISISSTASGSVTVNKTTDVAVDGPTTFVFEINPGGIPLTVDFAAGDDSGTGSVSGLALGDYTITETDAGGFTPAPDQNFSITLGDCDQLLDVNNTFVQATAQVQKITDPEDNEGGWTFNLYLDDDGLDDADPNELYSTVTTTDASAISFPDALVDEGHYYILEVEQVGWENQGGTGECTFDVDYPLDADTLFSCTFTNTAKGTISVAKTVNGGSSSQTFVFELRQGAADTDPAPATTLAETCSTPRPSRRTERLSSCTATSRSGPIRSASCFRRQAGPPTWGQTRTRGTLSSRSRST